MTWQSSWELGTHITTADTGKPDIDENIMGVLDFWNGAVLKLDLMNPFEDKGQVLCGCSLVAHGFIKQSLRQKEVGWGGELCR